MKLPKPDPSQSPGPAPEAMLVVDDFRDYMIAQPAGMTIELESLPRRSTIWRTQQPPKRP